MHHHQHVQPNKSAAAEPTTKMGDPLSTGAAAAEDPAAANIHGDRRWIWFITGPTACGKTTIAKALACHLGFTFVEGDDVRVVRAASHTPTLFPFKNTG